MPCPGWSPGLVKCPVRPNTKKWSLLPDDRVQIFDNRVEITLTDGGIGDDDGLANGRISDPGGIAIVRNLDTIAPTLTGAATSQPNSNGWYNDDVTVQWTVTDADPSSGIVAQPSDTSSTGRVAISARIPVRCVMWQATAARVRCPGSRSTGRSRA